MLTYRFVLPFTQFCYYNYSGTSEQRTLWDHYKFKWFVPCIEIVLFMRFQSHYIDRGAKIWGFSFVHWREVVNTVSFYRKVLFERFHCTSHSFTFVN